MIDIVNSAAHALGVIVEVIIHLLGTRGKSVGLSAYIKVLSGAGNLAGLRDIDERVDIHLRMDAQILQITLGDHLADGIGHTADAQLQAGAVRDLFHDQFRDGLVDLRGRCRGRESVDGRIVRLNDHIYLIDVDIGIGAAQTYRHIFIDFYDDLLCFLNGRLRVAGAEAQIKVSESVHGSDLHDRYIQRILTLPVVAGQLRIFQRAVESEALGDRLTLHAAHMPAVPCHMICRVLNLEDFRNMHKDAAAEIDIFQLGQTLCQFTVYSHTGRSGPAVVYPVSALYDSRRLCRCDQLLLIFLRIIHIFPPYPCCRGSLFCCAFPLP